MIYNEYNNDQRRELVNTQQRFATWQKLQGRVEATRGSMVWRSSNGLEYLARSHYDSTGIRRQKSLGPRSPHTEALREDYQRGRGEARAQFKSIDTVLSRQAAINRAIGLGRVPLVGAKIIRALQDSGLLGAGIRIIGTNAIYAYEAAAGVMVNAEITATEDIDLLFDSRQSITFVANGSVPERSLMRLLRQVDKSFELTPHTYRAENSDAYMVDLVKPMRNPPWRVDATQVGDAVADNLSAAEIEGLVWLENAPGFESVVIDEKGMPLRLVAPDPRVWAVHKHWLAQRKDRNPLKRRRDAAQAVAVAGLVRDFLLHLPFVAEELRMLPKHVVDEGAHLFR